VYGYRTDGWNEGKLPEMLSGIDFPIENRLLQIEVEHGRLDLLIKSFSDPILKLNKRKK